jgi:hypothetical protein
MTDYEDDDLDFLDAAEDDDLDDLIDALEEDDDLDSEDAERKRARRRARRVSRAGGKKNSSTNKKYFETKLKGYATKNEVKAGFKKIAADFSRVNRRVGTVAATASSNARVNASQTKAIRELRAELEQQRQMQMMMTLLDSGTSTLKIESVTNAGRSDTELAVGSEIKVKEQGDKFSKMLPMLLLGGGMGKSNDSTMMVMMLSMLGDD